MRARIRFGERRRRLALDSSRCKADEDLNSSDPGLLLPAVDEALSTDFVPVSAGGEAVLGWSAWPSKGEFEELPDLDPATVRGRVIGSTDPTDWASALATPKNISATRTKLEGFFMMEILLGERLRGWTDEAPSQIRAEIAWLSTFFQED
jgi:hypothetical protein